MKKRLLFITVLLLCVFIAACGKKEDEPIEPVSFPDVAEDAWYYDYVSTAAGLGLFSGYEDGTFAPDAPITNAESVKLAAAAAGMEDASAKEGEAWYSPYSEFCYKNNILVNEHETDWYSESATRETFACLLARAAGKDRLDSINSVEDGAIPDYVRGLYSDEIYSLYRAGVVIGDSGTGAFRAHDTLTRAEGAAMLCRLYDSETRQRVTLVNPQYEYVRYDKVPVLMYHEVNSVGSGDLYLTPDDFQSEIDWLVENGWHGITLAQLYAHWYENEPLPEKPVVLTFDDGYRTMYTEVLPRLKEAGFAGTFFVIPAARWSDWSMDESMFAEMVNNGMELGSHTYSHIELDTLSSGDIAEELASSKAIIEQITGQEVVSICYPSGAYNDTVLKEAEKAGYSIGVTTNLGVTEQSQGIYSLSRLRIAYGCGGQMLSAMLSGIYE